MNIKSEREGYKVTRYKIRLSLPIVYIVSCLSVTLISISFEIFLDEYNEHCLPKLVYFKDAM